MSLSAQHLRSSSESLHGLEKLIRRVMLGNAAFSHKYNQPINIRQAARLKIQVNALTHNITQYLNAGLPLLYFVLPLVPDLKPCFL